MAGIRQRIIDSAGGARPVVLVDGRSGSGKTTLAGELLSGWVGAQLVRLDDVYPGWDGLEAGSLQVAGLMLAASAPGWRQWDWQAARPGPWHPLDPRLPLIVEGAGALSRANRGLATFGIWVETDDALRKQRALARDGDTYAPYWDRWAAQEAGFIAREHPQAIADLVIRD